MARILALIALFIACDSRAATASKSCREVDLRSQFGSVRDQGAVGWCYAFAYADLLGQTLKMKPPDKVSAMDVAVTYAAANDAFTNIPLDKRHGGSLVASSESYLVRGRLCSESQIPSEPMKKGKERPFPFSAEEDESQYWVRQKVKNTWAELKMDPPPDSLELVPRKSPLDIPCNVGAFDLLSVRRASELRALSGRLNDWVIDQIKDKHDRTCAPDPRLEKIRSRLIDIRTAGTNGLRKEAASLLSKNQPFIIGFNSTKFKKNHDGGNHAAVVVGRRWNKESKTCELLVRNSWGTGCGHYRSDIKCENGHFWASEKELLSQTDSILSLKQ